MVVLLLILTCVTSRQVPPVPGAGVGGPPRGPPGPTMDRLSNKFKLVRSQSIGVGGMGVGGEPKECLRCYLQYQLAIMTIRFTGFLIKDARLLEYVK